LSSADLRGANLSNANMMSTNLTKKYDEHQPYKRIYNLFFIFPSVKIHQVLLCGILKKRGKGIVGGREAGKKAKTTQDAGGQSVSLPFEKSESK
jgi:hypothetical protein